MPTIHVNKTAAWPQPATTIGYATADTSDAAWAISGTARLHLDVTGRHPANLPGWTPVITDPDALAAFYPAATKLAAAAALEG